MDEKIPQLTLTPELTLEPQESAKPEPAPEPQPDNELQKLSAAEQEAVHTFAQQIDLTNSAQILQYGVAAQKNITDFSESALSSVRTKDLG